MPPVLSALGYPDGTFGGTASKREVHTWAVGGALAVASGNTDYIPPMFVSVAAGETLILRKFRARINGGTSVVAKLTRTTSGGSATDLATGTSITTTASDSATINQTMADNDMLQPILSSPSGSPVNLTITAIFDRVS